MVRPAELESATFSLGGRRSAPFELRAQGGATDWDRTSGLDLTKIALYQLSYGGVGEVIENGLVPAKRLELSRDCSHENLNLARLPVSPRRHRQWDWCDGSDSNRQNLSALNGATLPFCPPSHIYSISRIRLDIILQCVFVETACRLKMNQSLKRSFGRKAANCATDHTVGSAAISKRENHWESNGAILDIESIVNNLSIAVRCYTSPNVFFNIKRCGRQDMVAVEGVEPITSSRTPDLESSASAFSPHRHIPVDIITWFGTDGGI